jgi:hypothetical protein
MAFARRPFPHMLVSTAKLQRWRNFRLGGSYWMIVDEWRGQAVYRSVDGTGHWIRRNPGVHGTVGTTKGQTLEL